MKKGEIIGGVLLVAATATTVVIVINKKHKKALYNQISTALDKDPTSSASQAASDAATAAIAGILNPNWWKKVAMEVQGLLTTTGGTPIIMIDTLQKGADEVNGYFPSLTRWITNDDAIIGYLTSLGSKVKVSYLSYLFTKSGYGDLYSLLAQHLNAAKWAKLQQTILGFKQT